MSSTLTGISRSEIIPQCSKARWKRVVVPGFESHVEAASQGLPANGSTLDNNPVGQVFQSTSKSDIKMLS